MRKEFILERRRTKDKTKFLTLNSLLFRGNVKHPILNLFSMNIPEPFSSQ